MGLLGKDCKLYRNSGTFASETFVEIPEATGVTITGARAAGDISGRGDSIKTFKGARPEIRITGSVVWRSDNANIDALRTAFFAGTSVLVAALDGEDDVAGSEGVHGAFEVIKWDRTEEDEAGVKYDFELVPSNAAEFEWYTVSGS